MAEFINVSIWPKKNLLNNSGNVSLDFAVAVVRYLAGIPATTISRVVIYQLTKLATSGAANYRAACRARSKAEFHAKMSIVVEEMDESQFWLEFIERAELDNSPELKRLQQEALEITKVCSKARSNS